MNVSTCTCFLRFAHYRCFLANHSRLYPLRSPYHDRCVQTKLALSFTALRAIETVVGVGDTPRQRNQKQKRKKEKKENKRKGKGKEKKKITKSNFKTTQ